MTSNALERAMFDAFRASLAERAQRPADRYAQCFLEPVFATTCERSRRCIPKFMEGVAAKVAFSHDVLARLAPGQLMCFLDTDTVALRSLAAVAGRAALPERPAVADGSRRVHSPGRVGPRPNVGKLHLRAPPRRGADRPRLLS